MAIKDQRYRIVSDDDGHDYIIPVGDETQFEKWVEAAPYWEGYVGPDYEDCAVGGAVSNVTFTNYKIE